MKKISKESLIRFIPIIILSIIPFIFSICIYDSMPNVVATHFNMEGVADGFSSKAFAFFGMPAVMAIANFICILATEKSPRKENIPNVLKNIVYYLIPLLAILCVGQFYIQAKGGMIPVQLVTKGLLSLIFIVIGNYLPKCKQNSILGIKTPWTLENTDVWYKTHRFGGYVFIICGLLVMLTVVVKSNILFLISLISAITLPILYSYIVYAKVKNN